MLYICTYMHYVKLYVQVMDKFCTHSMLEKMKLFSIFTSPINKFEVTRISKTKTSSRYLLNTRGFDKNIFIKLLF